MFLDKFKSGFTLVELLVVISIFGVLSIIVTTVLVQSLRGSQKVQVLNRAKQNSQIVLDRMIKDIQSANEVWCTGNFDDRTNNYNGTSTAINYNSQNVNYDTLILVTFDQSSNATYNRYRFYAPFGTSTNGYIAFDTKTVLNGSGGTPLNCNNSDSDGTGTQTNPNILTDTDGINGVSINYYGGTNCNGFTSNIFCDTVFPYDTNTKEGGLGGDSVTIKFRVFAAIGVPSLFQTTIQANGTDGIPFSASATVRNINQG